MTRCDDVERRGRRHRSFRFFQSQWLLPAVCWLLLAAPSDATVLLPADFQEVVDGSQIIVRGTVSSVSSQMTAGRRTIESLVSLAVAESIKGPASRTVTFKVPNGRVGRYRRVMVGAPEFQVGDEVVVFLRAAAPAIPTLFGLSQGVYRVVHGAAAGDLVSPPPAMTGGLGSERVVRGDPARTPVPVALFVHDVRTLMARRP